MELNKHNSVELSENIPSKEYNPATEHLNIDFDLPLFINRLAVYLLAHKNPKLCLVALLFLTGHDVGFILGCENNKADICRKMEVKESNFINLVNSIKEELLLERVPMAVNKKKSFIKI